jgi:hypothetical protein
MPERKNKVKSYDLMLQKHIDKNDFVKINRTFQEKEENISGFILAMSKDFLLLQVDNEFLFNGYAIIRKDQFDSLRCNKFDNTFKKIYKAEGTFERGFGIDKNITLNNWQDIFKDLKKFDYHVIVECEDKDEPDFVIGPIKRVTKDKIGIQYYDPTGQLEEKYTYINLSEITIVKFDDNYSKTFRKYLKPNKSTK